MTEPAADRPQDTAKLRPSAVPWPPILFGVLAGLAILMERVRPLSWPGLDDLAARVIGLGIGAAGIALAAWAIVTMHRASTTVMPHRSASKLVTTGPFHRFRNPIYIADVMILLGIAEATKTIWFAVAAIVFIPLVTWLAILPEERHLAAKFGAEWEAYRARSRRWL